MSLMSCANNGIWQYLQTVNHDIFHISQIIIQFIEALGILFYVRINRKTSYLSKNKKAADNAILPIYIKPLKMLIYYIVLSLTVDSIVVTMNIAKRNHWRYEFRSFIIHYLLIIKLCCCITTFIS